MTEWDVVSLSRSRRSRERVGVRVVSCAMSMRSVPVKLLENARRLRGEATDAESLLWQMLRGRRFGGFKFKRQVPVAPFIPNL